jgi:hypothetical protein
MSAHSAALLADLILVAHVAVVAFVVGGEALFLLGRWRHWRWVRRRRMRQNHIGLMVFIAAQSWLGQICPLTQWEQSLRGVAGQTAYSQGFIEYWLARMLYVQAPWWAFVAAYTAFAVLVIATWFWVPPERICRPDDTGHDAARHA